MLRLATDWLAFCTRNKTHCNGFVFTPEFIVEICSFLKSVVFMKISEVRKLKTRTDMFCRCSQGKFLERKRERASKRNGKEKTGRASFIPSLLPPRALIRYLPPSLSFYQSEY